MTLVTGATGTIGSHLVTSLLGQGAQVRVLVRDSDRARAAFGDRVDIVSGDLLDTSSVSVAMKGVDSVPELAVSERVRPDAAAIDRCGRRYRCWASGAPSVTGAAPDSTTSYGRGHFALDEHLKSPPRCSPRCRNCADR